MDTATHRAAALDHLDAIAAYSECLTVEWSKTKPDATEVKYLTTSISRGLDLARIHAELHTGAQLERIANALEDRPSALPTLAELAELAEGRRVR